MEKENTWSKMIKEVEIINDSLNFLQIKIDSEILEKWYYRYKGIYIRKETQSMRKQEEYEYILSGERKEKYIPPTPTENEVWIYDFECLVSAYHVQHYYGVRKENVHDLVMFHNSDYPDHTVIDVRFHKKVFPKIR